MAPCIGVVGPKPAPPKRVASEGCATGQTRLASGPCASILGVLVQETSMEEWEMKILRFAALAIATLFVAHAASAAEAQVFKTSKGDVKITPIYHAAMLIEAGGKKIYVDPAKPAVITGMPKGDLILITDIHGDHMDQAEITELRQSSTEILAPPAVVKTITNAKPISNGESKDWNGWKIEAIPMYNIKRGPAEGKLYHDKGRGNGYVLTYGGKRFYLSGDTEDIPEMEALKNIDVAFVCMNLPYTMTVEQAARAVRAFKPRVVYPYHYRGSDLNKFKELVGTDAGVEV